MEPKAAFKRIEEIDEKVTKLREEQDALKSVLVEACPIKEGDVVEVNGYSYNGKKMKVTSVRLSLRNSGPERKLRVSFMVYGLVLKADDTPGVREARNVYPVPFK